jgi:hypothetical protein
MPTQSISNKRTNQREVERLIDRVTHLVTPPLAGALGRVLTLQYVREQLQQGMLDQAAVFDSEPAGSRSQARAGGAYLDLAARATIVGELMTTEQRERRASERSNA